MAIRGNAGHPGTCNAGTFAALTSGTHVARTPRSTLAFIGALRVDDRSDFA